MTHTAQSAITFQASDFTGAHGATFRDFPGNTTIGDMVRRIVQSLGLSARDRDGREVAYQARLEREGRNLNASETVADAIRTGDELVLQPNIDAG